MAAAMEGWQPITMDMADSVPSVQRKRSGAEVEHFLGLQDAAHFGSGEFAAVSGKGPGPQAQRLTR